MSRKIVQPNRTFRLLKFPEMTIVASHGAPSRVALPPDVVAVLEALHAHDPERIELLVTVASKFLPESQS